MLVVIRFNKTSQPPRIRSNRVGDIDSYKTAKYNGSRRHRLAGLGHRPLKAKITGSTPVGAIVNG